MTPKWLVKGLVFYWVYHIIRFAMPTASHVSGMASSLPKLHISTIRQGLVTVPFWVYWTSPYSSHYRPYT